MRRLDAAGNRTIPAGGAVEMAACDQVVHGPVALRAPAARAPLAHRTWKTRREWLSRSPQVSERRVSHSSTASSSVWEFLRKGGKEKRKEDISFGKTKNCLTRAAPLA